MKSKSSSVADLKRRLGAMRGMWGEVISKIEHDTGLTPELIAREFVKKAIHQAWRAI